VTLCGWECNRRSGVALAMRHRLSGPSTYGLNGLDREMSTPPKPHWVWPIYLPTRAIKLKQTKTESHEIVR